MSTPNEFISLELLADIAESSQSEETLLFISVECDLFEVGGSLVESLMIPPREVFPNDYYLAITRVIGDTYLLIEHNPPSRIKVQGTKAEVLTAWAELVEALTL